VSSLLSTCRPAHPGFGRPLAPPLSLPSRCFVQSSCAVVVFCNSSLYESCEAEQRGVFRGLNFVDMGYRFVVRLQHMPIFILLLLGFCNFGASTFLSPSWSSSCVCFPEFLCCRARSWSPTPFMVQGFYSRIIAVNPRLSTMCAT
jgi:hypothetical protein